MGLVRDGKILNVCGASWISSNGVALFIYRYLDPAASIFGRSGHSEQLCCPESRDDSRPPKLFVCKIVILMIGGAKRPEVGTVEITHDEIDHIKWEALSWRFAFLFLDGHIGPKLFKGIQDPVFL